MCVCEKPEVACQTFRDRPELPALLTPNWSNYSEHMVFRDLSDQDTFVQVFGGSFTAAVMKSFGLRPVIFANPAPVCSATWQEYFVTVPLAK